MGESVELSRLGGMFAIKCALPSNITFEGQKFQSPNKTEQVTNYGLFDTWQQPALIENGLKFHFPARQ